MPFVSIPPVAPVAADAVPVVAVDTRGFVWPISGLSFVSVPDYVLPPAPPTEVADNFYGGVA